MSSQSYYVASGQGQFVVTESDLANNSQSPDVFASFLYGLPNVPQTSDMHREIVTVVTNTWTTLIGYRGNSGATITLPSTVQPYPAPGS